MKLRKLALSMLLIVSMLLAMTGTAMAAEADLTISNLDDLKAFRDAVNGGEKYQGKTVVLAADIDLNNEEWTPIGTSSNSFNGHFDGQNHTISNLKITTPSSSYVGFFGNTQNGSVENLTIKNADIEGRLNVGVVAGQPYTSKYSNITVTGDVTVDGMSYVGGVFGKNVYADVTDITVDVNEGSYVKADSYENGTAYRTYVGGVMGFMGEGNITVKNVKSNIDVIGTVCDIGGITGIAHYGNTFENITCTGNVSIEPAPNTSTDDYSEMGGIAGVWMNATSSVTFTNCAFTGTLTQPEGTIRYNDGLVGNRYYPNTSIEDGPACSINGEQIDDNYEEVVTPKYTITYTDGADGAVFADVVFTEVVEGDATPAFTGRTEREGYTFEGWSPAVAETVTADATYTAQWKVAPTATPTTAPTATPAPNAGASAPAAPTATPAPAPKTGDNTNLVALSLLMVAAFIGIVVMSKKRAHN